MKKINIVFLIFSLVCFSYNGSAQTLHEKIKSQATIQKEKGFEPSLFGENLYVGLAAGTQILFSKDADNLEFSERFTPLFSLAIGKWVSPFWGLRLEAQGYSLNGYSTVDGIYLADPRDGSIYGNADPVRDFVTIYPDGSYRYFLRYFNAKLDFQLSLIDLIKGYKEQRRIGLISSIGLGYMDVLNYKGIPHTNTISANFELMGKYNLSNKIDINVKVQTSLMPDHFDGRIAGNKYEYYSSASLGLSYYFKKRGFKKVVDIPNIPIINIIKETDTIYKYEVINEIDTVYKIINWDDKKTIKKQVNHIDNNNGRVGIPAKKYIVKRDDYLYAIARNYYKDSSIWALIYGANQAIIRNPEVLPEGIEIFLPALQGSAGSLTVLDMKNISQGYMKVYFYYKNRNQSKALYALWLAKTFDKDILRDYEGRIEAADLDYINNAINFDSN